MAKAAVKKVETIIDKAPTEEVVDQAKLDIIELLKEMGVEVDPSKSTPELIGYLRKHTKELENKAVAVEMKDIDRIVAKMKGNTNISNEKFLTKLALMGVPPLYVHPYRQKDRDYDDYLFNDLEAERLLALDDNTMAEQVWSKIRHSGIEPVSRFSLFKQHFDK